MAADGRLRVQLRIISNHRDHHELQDTASWHTLASRRAAPASATPEAAGRRPLPFGNLPTAAASVRTGGRVVYANNQYRRPQAANLRGGLYDTGSVEEEFAWSKQGGGWGVEL